MNEFPKRGSSRRFGDDFQDLTALRLALEFYSSGADFKLFIEYEKAAAIDDIVIFLSDGIQAIQVKYAVDPLAVFSTDDFVEPTSKVFFGKFAEGWRQTRTQHAKSKIQVRLLSNRGRDKSLEGIVGGDGKFAKKFIDGSVRKDASAFRRNLKKACGFGVGSEEEEFKFFLGSFEFRLAQRPIAELENQIVGEMLDHQLGISDRRIFQTLKELVKRHAVETHEAITTAVLDGIFREAHSRFFLPQVFPVDHDRFVSLPAFSGALTTLIERTDSGYIVVTGLPGSGKSTSLSEFFDALEKNPHYAVCRYLCFVRPNDDALRLRIEAQTLRVNLLSEFHSRFPDILPRRHDYGERNFVDVLKALGEEATKQGLKLVVLLDGLDHAERDASVRDTVLDALPTSLPKGVVFVAGTQELKNWDVPLLKQARENRHMSMPLFTLEETRKYLIDKNALTLSEDEVSEIHRKSQGLPLYLHYVATWLKQQTEGRRELSAVQDAVDGDIREYYGRLWGTFARGGMEEARYLCGLFAALRFPIAEGEVCVFQDRIPSLKIRSTLNAIFHLLRTSEQGLSIFHDSFRVFVKSVFDATSQKELVGSISNGLARERGSDRWFSHAFQYAFDAGLYDYILKEINRQFVDFALGRSRTPEEILSSIAFAARAAECKRDLIEIARVGTLEARTTERVQFQVDMADLAQVQLGLGRIDDVLHICCRPHGQTWEVETIVALRVMLWLAASNHRDLGERILQIFRQTHERHKWDNKHEILLLAQVMGTYSKHPSHFLRFVAQMRFNPEMLERPDPFAPGYYPQLECFLGAYFNAAPAGTWKRFKRVKRLFPNHPMRHFLLRLAAARGSKEELKSEVEDYLANTPTTENLEVAGIAARACLPVKRVRELAGQINLPPQLMDRSATMSAIALALETFHWTALVVGYERDQLLINQVLAHIGITRTMWAGFLRFQFKARLGVAQDPFDTAAETAEKAFSALRELAFAGEEESSNEMDVLRHSRDILPDLLGELTELVAHKCADKLGEWCDRLLELRQSEIWTSHWSITESSVDYSFELSVWDRLHGINGMSSRLLPILESCAKTYEDATSLKGGSRTHHFMWLAIIAAKSGWKEHAEKWKGKALACSLSYGYHKDITLDYLIDTLEMLTRYEPEHGLRRSAAILEMSKWMRDVTDERETLHFEISVFDVVLRSSREAAFALIRFFRKNNARWSTLDCLEKYIASAKIGDPEALWILKDTFTPHFVERGRHPHQVARVAHKLAELGVTLEPPNAAKWRAKYVQFLRTHIDSGWWPEDVWNSVKALENRDPIRAKDPYATSSELDSKSYKVGGIELTQSQIKKCMEESVGSFCKTFEQLRAENEHFYGRDLVNKSFVKHVGATRTLDEVRRLSAVAKNASDKFDFKSLQAISNRLFELGDPVGGFQYLLEAYKVVAEYRPGGDDTEPVLRELCKRDKNETLTVVTGRACGADAPRAVARFYAACDDVGPLRKVFEDFLQQCEELFANLPPERLYDWLRDYKNDGRDEAREIVEFAFDLLDEPEVDQATRLLRVLTDLARTRSSLVCETCCRRLLTADPIPRERLESLVTALAHLCPLALATHIDRLLPLLESPRFKSRMTIVEMIKTVSKATTLSSTVEAAVSSAERVYSPLIAYPSRGSLLIEASSDFVQFAGRGALFYFRDKLSAVSEVLGVETKNILGYIERRLTQKGWAAEDEEKALSAQWRANSFDNKHVWFVPKFHQAVWDSLQEFLHTTLENGRFQPAVVSILWNIIKGADAEWLETLPSAKPADILAIMVSDGPKWLEELRSPAPLAVQELETEGWTTIFEERLLTGCQDADPRFVSTLLVRSLLVTPAAANRTELWPRMHAWLRAIPHFDEEENITLSEMRTRIMEVAKSASEDVVDFSPIAAAYTNGLLFDGYRRLASLDSAWVGALNLELQGTSAFQNGECVVERDTWQEGYEDDVYSRALLCAGVRLRIKNSALRQILLQTKCSLVLRSTEERTYHERWSTRNERPDVSRTVDKMLFVL